MDWTEEGGTKLGPHNGSLNTGPVMQTQTDCQADMMGTVSEIGGVLAQNISETVKKKEKKQKRKEERFKEHSEI